MNTCVHEATSKMAQQSQGALGNVFNMAGLGFGLFSILPKFPLPLDLVLHQIFY